MKLTQEKIKYFKNKLEEKKREVEHHLEFLNKEKDYGSDVDHFEEEMEEAEEFANQLAVKKTLEDELQNINDALLKIERDAYGRCEYCGNEIDTILLEANPESKYCKQCKISGVK